GVRPYRGRERQPRDRPRPRHRHARLRRRHPRRPRLRPLARPRPRAALRGPRRRHHHRLPRALQRDRHAPPRVAVDGAAVPRLVTARASTGTHRVEQTDGLLVEARLELTAPAMLGWNASSSVSRLTGTHYFGALTSTAATGISPGRQIFL